jgi:methylenetetrahydrofolate reductase (NADPH)
MEILRRFTDRFVVAEAPRGLPLMVSLSPLPSATTARWVKKNMGDSRIPAALIKRLEEAGDPKREGIAICAELMQEISDIPGVSGVNLMTTGDPDAIPAAIRASGLRGDQ